MNKQGVLVLWLVLLAGSVFGSGWIASGSRLVFWLLVAAHLAEFFIKRSVMASAGGSMGHHFVQTLIYGMFHWQPLEEQQSGGGGSEG